ncbi:acyl-CoA carboxylase epsilon subunit-like protein [Microcella putealis]|uniref:Acyl-CoA carboxylase epsilon subunit-like protein n=1 Tax=Microcella putealis TaxID=337005 RepID=A0A4Q7LRL3_9MICO|nr:acyl-CoA carboxylase epsilon subunit [Microcella putealis]RZS57384.1 acyl-CoA carboxylase epsilon subunit-like protein [Microcella putealis]TQM19473.1 acyl-CoA carboxylase epsilon subunit-like protein [Microcella putealis]
MSDATVEQSGEDARGAGIEDGAAPLSLRFVAGNPSDEELAAIQVVIAAVAAERAALGAEPVAPPVNFWERSARVMRAPLTAGPGQWRASVGLRP